MTGINSRTIHKCLKRMRERRNIENLPRSGGRRKTTPRDDRILKEQQYLIKELAVMVHLKQLAEDCFGKGTNVQ